MYLPDDEYEMPKAPAKKDKRFCRGKTGKEHQPSIVKTYAYPCQFYETMNDNRAYYSCGHAIRCSACGKTLKWRVAREQCPEFGKAVMEYDRRIKIKNYP